MADVLLILVSKITPRVSYTFSLFFTSLLPTEYKLTEDIEQYKAYNGPKFTYSTNPVENDSLFFYSSSLLYETVVEPQSINVSEWNGLKIFYQVDKGELPFDMFAAAFYLVSRYEEYLVNNFDQHKRIRANESLAFKNHFLDKPLINLWAAEFKKILLKKLPATQIEQISYTFIPTIDVDTAYAHHGKKWFVNAGSFLGHLVKLHILQLGDKTLTLLRLRRDKYDTYDYQESIFKKYNIRPIYFFLAAKRAKYDKNISTSSKHFSNLVRRVESFADVGIHPSYQSQSIPGIVQQEIKNVERYTKSPITKSRQHFLRVNLPETYRCLAELNIKDDYSLAYASCPGFRASICTPFFFYDLPNEEALPVKVHSSIVMDGTLKEYMQITPDDAIVIIEKLIAETRRANGEFISIWHNHSLGPKTAWSDWIKVFEFLVAKAV